MISLSGHLPQGGNVEEINYEKREKTRKGSRLENNLLYFWEERKNIQKPTSSIQPAGVLIAAKGSLRVKKGDGAEHRPTGSASAGS